MTDDDLAKPLDIAKYWLPEPEPEVLIAPEAAEGWCCFFPCPRCGHMETLETRLRWALPEPRRAVYLCGGCRQVFDHATAAELLAMGEWRRTRE